MEQEKLVHILEAALLGAGEALTLERMQRLFAESEQPDRDRLRSALAALAESYQGRSIELREVGGGFRIQTRLEYSEWVSRLWEERPPRYSRALLETLALIAYRQPITRGEIEEIRGVSVSTNIIRTLLEREWVRVVGHRDVPGKPAMYGSTRQFLEYFNLKSLNELPTLAEIRDIDSINAELALEEAGGAIVAIAGEESGELPEEIEAHDTDTVGGTGDPVVEETDEDGSAVTDGA